MSYSKSHSFTSDFQGRIDNISLAPSQHNSLAPLFEAITNSIQAIEEKYGKDNLTRGVIDVKIVRSLEDDSKPSGFVVTDNGIGFTEGNFKSFLTSDSRYKVARGGKGVGRLLWLKVFESVQVESCYEDDDFKKVSFDFVLNDVNQVRNVELSNCDGPTYTTVRLLPFRSEYGATCPSKTSTISNKIISHFLAYFINMHAPKIIVSDSDISNDLFDIFTNSVSDDKEYRFDLKRGDSKVSFLLHAFLLPKQFSDDERGNNAIYYGAHSRTVERHELDQALGLKYIDGDKVYFGFIESEYLNGIVNLERTHLAWPPETFEAAHRNAVDLSKEFLSEPIGKIRTLQAETVERIRDEHLRFLNIAKDPMEFARGLPLYVQRPEDVYLELSRAALRQYNRKKRSFAEAREKRLPDFDEKAREYAKELKSESLSSLAEYVLKRKLILEVFEDRMKFKDKGGEKYHFEEAVHEIIVPLRGTAETLNYDDHNLWIVDDSLAFYTYFASDKTIKAISGGESSSTKEPDLAIFDLGLGFEQGGSSEPITIVEFKRPRRDDYTLQNNPFVQVQDYVSKLRKAGVVRSSVDGRVIRELDDNSPFMCYVVADLEPSLRLMMQRFGPFYRKAGHGSYYKWDEPYKIFIEVTSYSEVLRGAKARHQAFFDKLGVGG